MVHKDHHADLPKDLRFLVIVTSDTLLNSWARGEAATDESGDVAESLILAYGHTLAGRLCLHNEVNAIRSAIRKAARGGRVDVVVISGGTGLGPKDMTVEAVSPLIGKALPGFGEMFRHLSLPEVGSSAMASRTLAGACGKILVFAVPGSPRAVKLAMERLILPESPHLLKMLRG
jgi:molybdenum cofactor biosynthesis protein B